MCTDGRNQQLNTAETAAILYDNNLNFNFVNICAKGWVVALAGV